MSIFTQSQSHGLFWDSEIREKVFGLPQCINDTTKFDIYCKDNKFDENENISIKTSGGTNIDCGDIIRFFDGDFENNRKITIILLMYKQFDNNKQITEIIEINYTEEFRNILFGTITREILGEYVQFIKSIPQGVVSPEIKKEYKIRKQKLQKEYNMKINISPKVDSKNQRRVQCSIPKIEKIFIEYPQFILSRTHESIIRGIPITSILESEKRIRLSKSNIVLTLDPIPISDTILVVD
jgi:hypothetical protein